MKNIEYLALKELFKKIDSDTKDSGYSYPIAAVIFDRKNKKIIASALNRKPENEKNLSVEEKSNYHAEHFAINDALSKIKNEKNLSILITIPPCHSCYEKIVNFNKINEIIFITRKWQSIKWKYRNNIITEKKLKLIDYRKINKQIIGIKDLLLENKEYVKNLENILSNSRK